MLVSRAARARLALEKQSWLSAPVSGPGKMCGPCSQSLDPWLVEACCKGMGNFNVIFFY